MAYRTIIVEKASKINLDLNNIVIYYENDPYWINLDEISIIMIEDPRCLISLKLIETLCEKGITTVFCDSRHQPIGSLITLYSHSRAPKKLKNQINWGDKEKKYLWTEIVKNKINNQIETLIKLDKINKISILRKYYTEITNNDLTNREGLASRTYFKELFGDSFKRFDEEIINFCLNYIYQVIRSRIAQEIVLSGYHPSIGIKHTSEYNHFNLADDFIEVYRPIVDYYVYSILSDSENDYLTSSLKQKIVNIINEKILIKDNVQKLNNSIEIYIQSLFNFLETGEINKIFFPSFI